MVQLRPGAVTFTWSNDELIYWRMNTLPGLNDFNKRIYIGILRRINA